MDGGPLNILLQELVDGQSRMETRLGHIETSLAERKGERRIVLWLFGTGSGAVGAIMSALVGKLFLHKGP